MGAAVGKAAVYFAAAPRTQAEARLAIAEHVILQWNRSPGADTGIWDAEATYTNGRLLAAVDEILRLAEAQLFPEASAARRRLDGALDIAMSRMVEEFLRLRVWNASQSQLCAAVQKLSVSLPASGVSLAFPSTGDRTSTASTAGDPCASGGSRSSMPDEVAALLDGEFLDELDLICPASVSVLHEIAHRVIRADYTKELLQAFTNAPCAILDRFLWIIHVECSPRTTEVVIKRWTLATKLVGKATVVMKRQLYEQNSGAFDGFKDEYFLAITKNCILSLLKFADGFTNITSHEKLIYIVGMYEALSNAAPSLLALFSGAHKELISQRSEDILAKLAGAIRIMTGNLITKIRSDCSHLQSATDGGVGVLARYAMARYAMTCIELLTPHRDTLDLILANGGVVASLAHLVSRLIWCLEHNLEEKSTLCDTAVSRHLFLANNASFVLKRTVDADVKSLLGGEWAARHQSRIEQHVASYLEASWAPVVACLETVGRKPVKVVAKFNSAFDKAYRSQIRCEVPDPALREALRKGVLETVIPAYNAYLQKHSKLEKSVKYTADKLAEMLSELFEGESAERRKD